MRFELITNDTDTIVGMRLAGISGKLVTEDKNQIETELKKSMDMPDVAIVLITEGVARICESLIYELKSKYHKPLIVEIPDSKSVGKTKKSITKYINEAIGLKI
ncbi:MAG: V-type ATP synthase subunit F [Clostridia bacterium]|nr:V-type ATP synthase subunit F [Clostridia bacterium]MBQ3093238.1 V-type ATP synthase subunit F [Clostridia bacterium]